MDAFDAAGVKQCKLAAGIHGPQEEIDRVGWR